MELFGKMLIVLCLLDETRARKENLYIDKNIVFLLSTAWWRQSHTQFSSAFSSFTWCTRTTLTQIQGTPISQRTTLPNHAPHSPPSCRTLTNVLQPCCSESQRTCFIFRWQSAIFLWTQRSRPDLVFTEDSRKLGSCKQWRFPKGCSTVLWGHPTWSVQPHPFHQQVSSILQTEAVPQESRGCKASYAAQPKMGKGRLLEIAYITLKMYIYQNCCKCHLFHWYHKLFQFCQKWGDLLPPVTYVGWQNACRLLYLTKVLSFIRCRGFKERDRNFTDFVIK